MTRLKACMVILVNSKVLLVLLQLRNPETTHNAFYFAFFQPINPTYMNST